MQNHCYHLCYYRKHNKIYTYMYIYVVYVHIHICIYAYTHNIHIFVYIHIHHRPAKHARAYFRRGLEYSNMYTFVFSARTTISVAHIRSGGTKTMLFFFFFFCGGPLNAFLASHLAAARHVGNCGAEQAGMQSKHPNGLLMEPISSCTGETLELKGTQNKKTHT